MIEKLRFKFSKRAIGGTLALMMGGAALSAVFHSPYADRLLGRASSSTLSPEDQILNGIVANVRGHNLPHAYSQAAVQDALERARQCDGDFVRKLRALAGLNINIQVQEYDSPGSTPHVGPVGDIESPQALYDIVVSIYELEYAQHEIIHPRFKPYALLDAVLIAAGQGMQRQVSYLSHFQRQNENEAEQGISRTLSLAEEQRKQKLVENLDVLRHRLRRVKEALGMPPAFRFYADGRIYPKDVPVYQCA